MSQKPKGDFELTTSPSLGLALAVSVIAVVVIGVYPAHVLNFAKASIAGIM